MQVTSVSARLRYSGTLGQGRHKTVELSAEASLAPDEDWRESQAALYGQLGEQLNALWEADEEAQSPFDDELDASDDSHFCDRHSVPFQRHEKDGSVWYSHRTPEGWWCRERKAA